MHDIKTKETVRDIKVLDRSAVAAEHIKKAAVRAKDTAQNLIDDGQGTPEEYAQDQMKYAAQDAKARAEHRLKQAASRAKERVDARRGYAAEQGRHATAAAGQDARREKAAHSRQSGNSRGRLEGRIMRRRQQTVKTGRADRKALKVSGRQSRFESGVASGRSLKTAENAGRVTVKTTGHSTQRAEKAAKAARKTAEVSASLTKKAAAASWQTAAAVKEGVSKAVKAASAAVRSLVATTVAGGGAAAFVIIVICVVALLVGSCYGIFFTGETEGEGGQSMREVIQEINEDYQGRLDAIKVENPHDKLEMSGSRAVWPEVLSVYAVKTTTDPENSKEVATMTEEKKQILSELFWQMNEISFRSETSEEKVITETDDGKGNIQEAEKTEKKTTLYITVSHKTAEEMAEVLRFNNAQMAQMQELLSVDGSMWLAVLYGIYGSDDMIVQIALSQVGCVGGETFWSWYGFGARVEWCACFVSWCADQCGYIENGIIPKYAGCPNGVAWFKERGQWADNTIEPSPGMIIFYDWDNRGSSGPQDGEADHTGIVVHVENGIVYTVEGNCGETCMELQHAMGDYQILGYGVPNYK